MGGLFWLAILVVLTFSDFATRGWLPVLRMKPWRRPARSAERRRVVFKGSTP